MSTTVEDATFLAAKQGREEDIRELLNVPTANWNAKDPLGNTPLHYAAAAGHLTVVRLLCTSKKADVNAVNNQGDTPLHKAVGGKETEEQMNTIEVLVECGANVDAKDKQGYTPASVARTASLRDAITRGVTVPGWNPSSSDDEAEKGSGSEDDDDDAE